MTEYFTIKETKKKTSEILSECRKLFDAYSFYDDAKLDKDFPPPKKMTTRKFKKVVEADEENANRSAEDLKGAECITLRERLLMELQYFKETKEHLDVKTVTLCAGSRDSDGYVPGVGGYAGRRRLFVYWCYSDDRDGLLRARVAVSNCSSLSPLTLSDAIERVKAEGYEIINKI